MSNIVEDDEDELIPLEGGRIAPASPHRPGSGAPPNTPQRPARPVGDAPAGRRAHDRGGQHGAGVPALFFLVAGLAVAVLIVLLCDSSSLSGTKLIAGFSPPTLELGRADLSQGASFEPRAPETNEAPAPLPWWWPTSTVQTTTRPNPAPAPFPMWPSSTVQTTTRPNPTEPPAVEPTAAAPAKPTAAKPTVATPTTARPSTTKPTAAKPTAANLATTTAKPTTTTALAKPSINTPCPLLNGEALGCPDAGGRKVIFLTITGLRHRMLFETTSTAVIQSLAQEGFAVHVYINLVEKNDTVSWRPERRHEKELPHVRAMSKSQMQEHYKNLILDKGGCLVCFNLGPKETLPKIPNQPVFRQRMHQYSPAVSEVGRNVLRIWQARKHLWIYAQRVEKKLKFRYSMAIWARDDSRWIGKLRNVSSMLEKGTTDECSRCLWSKNCKQWHGINDKVILMGRQAASVMYSAYDAYLSPGGPALTSFNSEQFLKQLGHSANLIMRELRHDEMPSGDAMYVGKGKYCFMQMYFCGSRADLSQSGATFCEELFGTQRKR